MSNLGFYQAITRTIKVMGGPKGFVAIVGSVFAGTAITSYRVGLNRGNSLQEGKTTEKKIIRWTRKVLPPNDAPNAADTYEATVDSDLGGGLLLKAGYKFTVAATSDDMVWIEVRGDKNNPYLVSAEQLATVSNFANDLDADEEP